MKFRIIAATVTAFVFLSSVTNGGIKEIGPFKGTFSEGFENRPTSAFVPQIDVFGSEGIVRTIYGDNSIIVTIGWTFFGTVWPHNGSNFMGSCQGPVEWVFDTPALKFGGYFTTNSGTSDALAKFYDENGNLLDELNVTAPADNSWVWNGWETDAAIKRVQIIGYNPWGGGFIMQDDIEFTPVPEPATVLLLGLGSVALVRKRRA